MNTTLQGKTALISGATSGIGKAIAFALAKEGVRVCVIGRRSAVIKNVTAQITKRNGQALGYCTDVTSEKELRALVESVKRKTGGIDILVHSAGIIVLGNVEVASVKKFDEQYAVNVRAPYLLTQLCLPSLTARKGQIVFINSTTGLTAGEGKSQYAGTKFALKALADSLRAEVNNASIRVVSIFCGSTATPMQQRLYKTQRKPFVAKNFLQPEDVAQVVINTLFLPDSAEITDITVRPLKKP